ncbi:MAG: hypothetical protein JNM95_14920 [Chitinophagaceae bacterium]|nr:hypothetical protein [Chitinophagaceae bacterium]
MKVIILALFTTISISAFSQLRIDMRENLDSNTIRLLNSTSSIYLSYADSNSLSNLIELISRKDSIKYLTLYNYQSGNVPSNLRLLLNLKKFYIKAGRIVDYKEFVSSLNSGLESLDLSILNLDVNELICNISTLKKLKFLFFSCCKNLIVIPPSIRKLKTLRMIGIYNCPIKQLDNEIYNMEELKLIEWFNTLISKEDELIIKSKAKQKGIKVGGSSRKYNFDAWCH